MPDKMVLVDGNSLMYRAFHALPLLDNGEGVYTNAAFGFFSMLFKVLREEKPRYCAVAFDLHGPTFRHERYGEYKAGRAPTPDELRPQFPLVKELLGAMHVAVVSLERYEADDMLGTLSKRCEDAGVDALLVTGDRDAFQLAGPHTDILYTKRGITDTERVSVAFLKEKYGLTPDQMIDLKGLMGDNSDNIPGVPGVGEKTALKLLAQYGTLENVLQKADTEQKGKLRERLMTYADQARFSKQIATVERNAPVEADFESLRLHGLRDALPAFEKYKLKTLAQRLNDLPPELAGGAPIPDGPAAMPEQSAFAWQKPEQAADTAALRAWADQNIGAAAAVSVGETVSAALENGRQVVAALGGDLINPGMSEKDALHAVGPLLTGEGNAIVCGLKDVMHLVGPIGKGAFDVSLAAYALNPQRKSFAAGALIEEAGLAQDPNRTQAGALMELSNLQRAQMARDGLTNLFETIEMPLCHALYHMETAGFLVDEAELHRLGKLYRAKIDGLTAKIRAIAGGDVNVNSPKQLGELLFEKLGVKGPKKTGKGWSTAADVLEEVADQHEIIPMILEYRKYFKLNSTYIEALLRLRKPDGRVYTSLSQTATATGRISSLEPNLQNIPVRTELGREIRGAFIAPPGWVLVDADYSQIELRVLSSMAGDPAMIEAFRLGQDIHRRTAADVYGVPLEAVTKAMRSAAKAVNFGIVYGISDFGLARNIGVTRREAGEFIARYFERYPSVKKYMDKQVALGKTQGYVTTLFGRRRYLPELSSPNYNIRAFGERAAMNSPIQGTAADIIKLAMIRVDEALRARGLAARLILQVHDELIVEAPLPERAQVEELLRSCMEGAAELAVPLKADVSSGGNWNECKD